MLTSGAPILAWRNIYQSSIQKMTDDDTVSDHGTNVVVLCFSTAFSCSNLGYLPGAERVQVKQT